MSRADDLRSTDVDARLAAIVALGERGSADAEEIDALAACLGDDRKAVGRRAAEAFAALGARGVPVGAVLERTLAAGSARQRWAAAFALALLGDPPARVLPVLLETLGSDDGDLRWAAAQIVVRIGDRTALLQGLRGLLQAGNAAQRKMALYCLRDLDARSADVEASVLRCLGDEEWDVRLAAIATLARLSIDRHAAAARLLGALGASDERERRAAAAALGLLGERTDAVIAGLRAASASPDASLRRAAEGALRQLAEGEDR